MTPEGWRAVIYPLQPTSHKALRIGLGVLLSCLLGFGVILPWGATTDQRLIQYSQACKWAAITCVNVAAPVTGKVAQVGFERVIGTVAGGLLGYATYEVGRQVWKETASKRDDGILLSFIAMIVAATAVMIGARLKLDYSAKLFTLTFLLVTFGAEAGVDTKLLMTTRIAGICGGVLISLFLAVIIFPKTATQEAVCQIRTALLGLVELNRLTWQQGNVASMRKGDRQADEYIRKGQPQTRALSTEEEAQLLQTAKDKQHDFETTCEKILMDIYNALYKFNDFIPQAKGEIYIGSWWGRPHFMPGLPWFPMGRYVLPVPELTALATTVRQVARLQWALLLAFEEGFDDTMQQILQQQYPTRLLPQLAESSTLALQDMAESFPNQPVANSGNLHRFIQATEGLLSISDYQRRRILRYMKQSKRMQRSKRNTSRWTDMSLAAASRANSTGTLSPARSHGLPSPVGSPPHAPKPARAPSSHRPIGLNTVPVPLPADDASASGLGPDEHVNLAEDNDPMMQPLLENPEAEGKEDDNESSAPAASAFASALVQRQASSSSVASSMQPRIGLGSLLETGRQAWTGLATIATSFKGNPMEAFNYLPPDVCVLVQSERNSPTRPSFFQQRPSMVMQEQTGDFDDAAQRMTITLPRVNSSDLILFPETAEGYVSQIHWCTFQCLMEEFAEELHDMHETLSTVLLKLPRGTVKF